MTTLFDINQWNEDLASASASQVLQWGFDRFEGKISIASSFGLEDVALIGLAAEAVGSAGVRVFCLDTGRLHDETLETLERVKFRLGVEIDVYSPNPTDVDLMVESKGLNSFYESVENRKECCQVRKQEPLRRALGGLDAWVTGLRREQNVTRSGARKVELDLLNGGMVKLNPLVDWTLEQTWDFVRSHEIPFNPLHEKGFPSIGCEPCTRAVESGADPRSGRWWWETPESRECGLHAAKGTS